MKVAIALFLLYHQIGPIPANDVITFEKFEEQMRSLHESGVPVISTHDAMEGKWGIVLHFDDGWKSQLRAIPVLKRYGFPASFFISTGIVGWKDHLTWPQVKEIAAGYEVYSHAVTHSWCGDGGECDLSEYARSKETLEAELGRPVPYLAWPFGYYNEAMMRAASDYAVTFTVQGCTEGMGAIPRINVDGRN